MLLCLQSARADDSDSLVGVVLVVQDGSGLDELEGHPAVALKQRPPRRIRSDLQERNSTFSQLHVPSLSMGAHLSRLVPLYTLRRVKWFAGTALGDGTSDDRLLV